MKKSIEILIPKIQEFFAGQPVEKAWMFGSCSRAENTRNSDRLLLLQDIWKYVILFVFLLTILKTSTYGDDYTDIRRILKQGHATP